MAYGKKVEVEGKRVLVTGGVRGMGRLWVERFVADGAKVAVWNRSADALAAMKAEFMEKGHKIFIQTVDLTDERAVGRAVDELARKWGDVDILVNNAGVVVGGKFDEVPFADLAKTVAVNLTALMMTTRIYLPQMMKRGTGHVINVSSASGFMGVPFMPAYTASKWGVIGFTESIRLELKAGGYKDIGISLFCPSYVSTGMFDGAKPPALTPMLTPEVAVERAYAAFRAGEYLIREPFMVKMTPVLRALLPMGLFDAMADKLGVTGSMKDWKGHP